MAQEREFYTHGHGASIVEAHGRRSVTDSARFLLPFLTEGARLLDFGCGPGSITADLARHVGITGNVTGVDNGADAIAIASRDHRAPNVVFLQASVYDLPFPDASFDIAYGHQVLQHLADPVQALREIRRVLRPAGLIAVRDADYGSMTHYPHFPELDRWLQLYHVVARNNGGEPDAGRRLHAWVAEAGFTGIAATVSSWSYTTDEERRSWANLWADRISETRFAERARTVDATADVDALARAWRRWAASPNGWFAFLHGEVIASRPDTV